jgi:hypothetical protein
MMAAAQKHKINRYAEDSEKGKTYYWSCPPCGESGDFTTAIDRDTSATKHENTTPRPKKK